MKDLLLRPDTYKGMLYETLEYHAEPMLAGDIIAYFKEKYKSPVTEHIIRGAVSGLLADNAPIVKTTSRFGLYYGIGRSPDVQVLVITQQNMTLRAFSGCNGRAFSPIIERK